MRTGIAPLALAAFFTAYGILAGSWTLPGARAEARAAKKALPDVLWFTNVLTDRFQILDTQYDAAHRRIIWTLKAREDVKALKYDALFEDADGVNQGEIPVQWSPVSNRYRKGDTVRAVLRMPYNLAEVNKVTIRIKK